MWQVLIIISLLNQGDTKIEYKVLEKSTSSFSLAFSLSSLGYKIKNYENENFLEFDLKDIGVTEEIGYPELLCLRKIFEIPINSDIDFEIVHIKEERISLKELNLPRIKPRLPSVPKIKDAKQEFVINEEFYSKDEFYPKEKFEIKKMGFIREHEIAQFSFYPVRYNPLRNEIIVIKELKIKINFKNGDLNKTIRAYKKDNFVFKEILEKIIINYEVFYPQTPPLPIGLLIIVPDEWESYVVPLKKWKKEKGYYVKIAKLSQTGYDTTSIRNYIINLYNTWDKNLTFVILVGDVDKIPYFRSSEANNPINDLKYGLIVGNDYFPDVYVGRISIADISQLQNVINKTLNYEKVIWSAGYDWAKKAFFIASADPSWHQVAEGTHLYCMQIVRKNPHNMIADSVFAYYQSGSPGIITNALNNGRTLCTYSGHGMETGWSDYNGLNYYNSDVYNLTNTDKYPFVQSYACLTGKYDVSECFMEAWIRAPNKGGICSFGSSTYSYWDEDDILQRRLFDELFDTGYVWVMGAINAGKIELYNHYGNTPMVHRYFQMYNLFGDPSLILFTKVPIQMIVDHPYAIGMGNIEVEVTVSDQNGPVENALVCAMQNDSILDTKYTNLQGKAILNLNITLPDTVYLTVTAYNHIPYKGFMIPASGMPQIPTIVSPLDFARLPGLDALLKFYSQDPQNEGIEYRVKWSLYPDFSISDSLTTNIYPSGEIVSVTLQNLELNKTYWWKVKCRDPQGSGYWTPYTEKRSFTVAGNNLPENTCSWFQETGAQFSYNTFEGTKVEGDSVVLIPQGQTVVCTLLFENFEQGIVPSGWTVIDGNNDGYKWTVGTTGDLGSYTPPNYGTAYAYYSDDDAGSGVINYNEELLTPIIAVPQSATNLTFKYGYGFRVYQTGEKYRTHFRKKVGGVWTNWQQLKVYTSSGSGTDSIDLTNQLPCDSIQFRFFYSDSTASSHWGWACASDNVLIKYSYELQNNFGTMLTVPVLYSELDTTYPRTSWGDIIVYKGTPGDSICIQVEYFDGSNWNLVPDNLLPGNSTGIYGDTISINNLPPDTYHTLRVRCLFYRKTTETPENPTLRSLEVGNLARIKVKEKGIVSLIPFINVPRNIFKGNLIISYSIPEKFDKISLKIYDVNGRCVKDLSKKLIKGKENQIIVSDLKKGVYFIKFRAGEYRKDLKVIKIK